MAIDQSSSMREMKSGSSGGELWNSSQSRSSFANLCPLIRESCCTFSRTAFVALCICRCSNFLGALVSLVIVMSGRSPNRACRLKSAIIILWSYSVALLNEGLRAIRTPISVGRIFRSTRMWSILEKVPRVEWYVHASSAGWRWRNESTN